MKRSLLTGVFAFAAVTLFALGSALADVWFYGVTDKNPLEYQPGETMTFDLQVMQDGKALDGVAVEWTRTGDDGKTETGKATSSATEPIKIQTSITTPGFVRLVANAKVDGKNVSYNGGAGVLLDKIEGAPEPEDFDAYWAKQKERLAEVPIEVIEKVEVPSGVDGVVCYDMKIKCLGMPVSGYLAMPKDAKEKSLKAEVQFRGYSVVGASKPSYQARDKIAFQINAHGILNCQPQEYYNELNRTTLKQYAFNKEENEDPETAYFHGMALRLMRALQYVKTLPEWNGQDLVVKGGSQGGFQSILAAGLDPDVTECYPNISWCLNMSGAVKSGRLPGWFPEWTPALDYFDPVFHAKRIHCKVVSNVGLGDYTCPPSGQMIFFNNLKCPKEMTFRQGCTHGYWMPKCPAYTIKGGE